MWLKTGQLKREIETLIATSRDQAIRAYCITARIDKTQDNPKCRMSIQMDETVSQIISVCPKLAQKECKKRHDNVAKAVH